MTHHLFLSVILVLTLSFCCQAAYVFKVDPSDEECFSVASVKGGVIYGDWEMLDYDLSPNPLSIVITNAEATKRKHKSRRGVREGSFKVEVDTKELVYICIENGIVISNSNGDEQENNGGTKYKGQNPKYQSDDLPRTVGLDFIVEEKDFNAELHQDYSGILTMATGLTRELGKLRSHHEYMRSREAKHRDIVERTYTKLLLWVFLQCAGVLGMAVAQVMYLRRFLERRRYI